VGEQIPAWRVQNRPLRVLFGVYGVIGFACLLLYLALRIDRIIPNALSASLDAEILDYFPIFLFIYLSFGLVVTWWSARDFRTRTHALRESLRSGIDQFMPQNEVLVLYLRSFIDARYAPARPSWSSEKLLFSSALLNFRRTSHVDDPESALSEVLDQRCTFLAIGDTKTSWDWLKRSRHGALKIKTDDVHWKPLFLKFCERSQLIICFAGGTKSSVWEIQQIIGDPATRKKAFLFLPENVADLHRQEILKILKTFGVNVPESATSAWTVWLGDPCSPRSVSSVDCMVRVLSDGKGFGLDTSEDLPQRLWQKMLHYGNINPVAG
jgi:hypothetical protein